MNQVHRLAKKQEQFTKRKELNTQIFLPCFPSSTVKGYIRKVLVEELQRAFTLKSGFGGVILEIGKVLLFLELTRAQFQNFTCVVNVSHQNNS